MVHDCHFELAHSQYENFVVLIIVHHTTVTVKTARHIIYSIKEWPQDWRLLLFASFNGTQNMVQWCSVLFAHHKIYADKIVTVFPRKWKPTINTYAKTIEARERETDDLDNTVTVLLCPTFFLSTLSLKWSCSSDYLFFWKKKWTFMRLSITWDQPGTW